MRHSLLSTALIVAVVVVSAPTAAYPETAPSDTVVLRGTPSANPNVGQPAPGDRPTAGVLSRQGWDRHYDITGFDRRGYDTTGYDRHYDTRGIDRSFDRNYDTTGLDRSFDHP
jgi:hypothetical protein